MVAALLCSRSAFSQTAYAQYQLGWDGIGKCGFPEYTNGPDCRFHLYHEQISTENYH